MSDWSAVDGYVADHLIGDDAAFARALAANAAAGLPPIDVSTAQGKMLHLFARMSGARRVLEIGTLGGFSTIWLARALPDDGRIVSLEISEHHAGVARANLAAAGLADRVDVRVGPALASLGAIAAVGEGPFDLFFIDADKQNNAAYVTAAIGLSRPGSVIIVDNVVRGGRIVDPAVTDAMTEGTRRLYRAVGDEPRLSATVVQTVGAKGWDGFLLAVVD